MIKIKRFCKILNKNNIEYRFGVLPKGTKYLSIAVCGKQLNGADLRIYFGDEKSNTVTLSVYEICRFIRYKRFNVFAVNNALNFEGRYLKFYVTDEGRVSAKYSYRLNKKNSEKTLYEIFKEVVNELDIAYPEIAKVLYS